ncbi:type II secretion system protein [Mucisphaera sp.]|uniref:type II secretion system protein n=1 Tax=Mucisphaera sp. TaxID=2913024 RepID=UPI003D0AC7FC
MKRQKKAFTLIELLVVISIIALLIGILLPALGAARNTARGMSCLSNKRQIGIGIWGWAQDNKDEYPPAFYGGADGTDWGLEINEYIAGGQEDYSTTDLSEDSQTAYTCASAAIDGGRLHYGANLLVMHTYSGKLHYDARGRTNGSGTQIKSLQQTLPYKTINMRRPTETLVTADAGQLEVEAFGGLIQPGSVYAGLDQLDGGNVRNVANYYDRSDLDNEDVIDEGANQDGSNQSLISNLRWRHGGGSEAGSDSGSVNVLYGDGHASAQSRGTILKKNVRPDAPPGS